MTQAIKVDRLGKLYQLGATRPAFRTLRDTLGERLRGNGRSSTSRQTIWALRDVAFEIGQGEAIGVIGANGAGKTTLLKILSRITEPTEGEARLRGRVGSLLEVGTGFHPELTGRENVYLNGAILGMKRAEIAARFDKIVAFAGIETFLDTPVKRYSSGMYVRLAFAVAAHLEPDILLVDEVLSVGDYAFQRRCLGVMQEQTASQGRTVLFVSHNLAAVKMLTTRALWLDHGRVRAFGPTEDVFQQYVGSHRETHGSGSVDLSDLSVGRPRKSDPLVAAATFESIELIDEEGRTTGRFLERRSMCIRVVFRVRQELPDTQLELICRVATVDGLTVFSSSSGPLLESPVPGLYACTLAVDPNQLAAGSYSIELFLRSLSDIASARSQDLVQPAAVFDVEANPATAGDSRFGAVRSGLIHVDYEWDAVEQIGYVQRT